MLDVVEAIRCLGQELGQCGLAFDQRLVPQVLAVQFEQIKGVILEVARERAMATGRAFHAERLAVAPDALQIVSACDRRGHRRPLVQRGGSPPPD